MIRTFKTHEVRMQEELTESLWEFEPCEGDCRNKVSDGNTGML